MERPIRVLCVDDNELIAEAIHRRLRREPDFEWIGWLARASELAEVAARSMPDVVVLDVDIPGDDAFQAVRELARACPTARALMLSGHANRDYIEAAVAAGAWGYIFKSEDTDTIIDAMRQVAKGGFILRPESLLERRI